MNILSLVGMITSQTPFIIGTSFVIFSTTNSLVMFCIDIFIERFSDKTKMGKIRGLYLTIMNLAWVLSPLFAAFLITKEGGYRTIYIITLLLVTIMTIGLLFSVKTFKDKKYIRIPFLKACRYIREKYNMLAIMIINFTLQFFYAWMTIYTPIYLHEHLGLDWGKIGIIFTIMLVPFVLLQYPTGIIIDRYNVKKRTLLYVGFIIMGVSTIVISFIYSTQILAWIIILFITRIGASIIEVTSDIYIFKNINEEETYLLGLYRDMYPVAYIIAPILGTATLLIMPFRYIFIILGLIVLSTILFIPKLKYVSSNTISNANK